MTKRSAGILMYRGSGPNLRLLLVRPSGPFWANKDPGAWSIPKGEYEHDEEPIICAIREFKEELGSALHAAGARTFLELGELAQPSGKVITAWAGGGRFQDRRAPLQPVRIGVATQERSRAIVPGSGPGGMVQRGRGAEEDPAGAVPVHRPSVKISRHRNETSE